MYQKRLRVAVLISGSGTNLQAIIDAQQADKLDIDLVGVLSDRPDAGGLNRAIEAGVQTAASHGCGNAAADALAGRGAYRVFSFVQTFGFAHFCGTSSGVPSGSFPSWFSYDFRFWQTSLLQHLFPIALGFRPQLSAVACRPMLPAIRSTTCR